MRNNEFTFDFPEELGGQVMDITYWATWKMEDFGNEPTHHVWKPVLQDAGVESALMYTDDMDENGSSTSTISCPSLLRRQKTLNLNNKAK